MPSEALDGFIKKRLRELHISDEERRAQLDGCSCIVSSPWVFYLCALARKSDRFHPEIPHPLIDPILFYISNYLFDLEFLQQDDFDLSARPIVIPIPMLGIGAQVLFSASPPLIFINEYDIILGDRLAPILMHTCKSLFTQLESLSQKINPITADLYKCDFAHYILHVSSYWTAMMSSKELIHIIHDHQTIMFPFAQAVIDTIITYDHITTTLETADFSLFLDSLARIRNNVSGELTLHDVYLVGSVFAGYLHSKIFHEAMHLWLGHSSARSYDWPSELDAVATLRANSIARELDADIAGLNIGWPKQSGIDSVYAYIGWIGAHISDEVISLLRVSAYLGRSLTYEDHQLAIFAMIPRRPIIPSMFGSHPTASERSLNCSFAASRFHLPSLEHANRCMLVHATLRRYCISITSEFIDVSGIQTSDFLFFGRQFQFSNMHPLLGRDAFLDRVIALENASSSDLEKMKKIYNAGFVDFPVGDINENIANIKDALTNLTGLKGAP